MSLGVCMMHQHLELECELTELCLGNLPLCAAVLSISSSYNSIKAFGVLRLAWHTAPLKRPGLCAARATFPFLHFGGCVMFLLDATAVPLAMKISFGGRDTAPKMGGLHGMWHRHRYALAASLFIIVAATKIKDKMAKKQQAVNRRGP